MKQNDNRVVDTSIRRFLFPRISVEGVVIVGVCFAIAFFLMLLSNILGIFGVVLALFSFYFFQLLLHRLEF